LKKDVEDMIYSSRSQRQLIQLPRYDAKAPGWTQHEQEQQGYFLQLDDKACFSKEEGVLTKPLDNPQMGADINTVIEPVAVHDDRGVANNGVQSHHHPTRMLGEPAAGQDHVADHVADQATRRAAEGERLVDSDDSAAMTTWEKQEHVILMLRLKCQRLERQVDDCVR
jgi:hypothetical protein